jgi:hypothetical protein
MGLAGIQKAFNKLDTGLRRYDKEREILDLPRGRHGPIGPLGDDKRICHSGMDLAGIQKAFNKLDTGLRRYDKEREILDLPRGHHGPTGNFGDDIWGGPFGDDKYK